VEQNLSAYDVKAYALLLIMIHLSDGDVKPGFPLVLKKRVG
jgi:hypothetical protein